MSQGGTGNLGHAPPPTGTAEPGFEAPVAWNNANTNTAIFGGTAGTVTLDTDITLDGLTVSLPTAGGSGYSIGNVGEDNKLTFTGDKLVTTTATGTGTNQDVIIRAGIAGSPTMNIAARATDADNFSLLPGADVTQTIGTLNMLNTFGSNKKLILGGDSTGNVVDTVTWSVTNQQMFLTKRGAGDWTITNDLAFSTNRATRLYVEQGTLTLGGTNNSTTHKVGVATVTDMDHRRYAGRGRGNRRWYLYRRDRWFPAGSRAAYRIPLPRGSYRALVHFGSAGSRSRGCGASMCGSKRWQLLGLRAAGREGGCPGIPGTSLDDGVLEIEFRHEIDNPIISAIEVLRVD